VGIIGNCMRATALMVLVVATFTTGCAPSQYELPRLPQSQLPQCPADWPIRWTNCFGTHTFSSDHVHVQGGIWGSDKYALHKKYVGEWKDGRMHGRGTATYSGFSALNSIPVQGCCWNTYVGEFRDGKANGQGTYKTSSASRIQVQAGLWENDKFVGSAVISNPARAPIATVVSQNTTSTVSEDTKYNICAIAMDYSRTTWDPAYPTYVKEARDRGLTTNSCRQILGLQPVSNPATPSVSHARNQYDSVICTMAMDRDKQTWDPNYPTYIKEAKDRGLNINSCRQLWGLQPIFISADSSPRIVPSPSVRPPPTLANPVVPAPPSEQPSKPASPPVATGGNEVQLIKEGGTFKVPVTINGELTLRFTVDSGASDVSIPDDVVSTLIRTGTISESDFLGEQTYRLADGSKVKSQTFRIRQLTVGNRTVNNVMGSVAGVKGSLLLGQSFLSRFSSVKFDYGRNVLVLE